MQFPWLEDLEKRGHITPAAKEEIYANCAGILKTADWSKWLQGPPKPKSAPKSSARSPSKGGMPPLDWSSIASGVAASGTAAIGPMAMEALGKHLEERKDIKDTLKDIHRVKTEILGMPQFEDHKEKAAARFDEIAHLAPAVARNKPLMTTILKEKMHSGLTSLDAQNLSIIQASLMPAKTLSKLQKKASAEEFADTYITVVEMAKEAGLSGTTVGRLLANTLAMAGLSAAGGVGVGAVRHLLAERDKKDLNRKLTASFEEAMRLSSSEKHKSNELIHAYPEKARQAFQTLVHFAPHVAMEPNAARSFMNKLVKYDEVGGVQVDDVKNLSEIERNIRSGASGSPFFQGLAEGSKAFGLTKALEGSLGSLSKPLHSEMEQLVAEDMGFKVNKGKGTRSNTYKM